MRVYVLGAGASCPIYPLGGGLFAAIDEYVCSRGPLVHRFDYQKDWPKLKEFLCNGANPLLRQAYRNGNIEQIFTVLDLAESLFSDSEISMLKAAWRAEEPEAAVAMHRSFGSEVKEYRDVRTKLLWAMEDYFLDRNQLDMQGYACPKWEVLRRFGRCLESGDIVITFNYDSTIERVLLDQGKWSPSDGYGIDLVFQQSQFDETRVDFPPSVVKVLHLHGAIGWYDKLNKIVLDLRLLQGLGIRNVNASQPRPNKSQILLHPSFLKSYGGEDSPEIFSRLWKMAADALRNAEEVMIIGYSLPLADSAAWTLLHTTCDRERTTVVNPNDSVLKNRYGHLLKRSVEPQAMNLDTWLDSQHFS